MGKAEHLRGKMHTVSKDSVRYPVIGNTFFTHDPHPLPPAQDEGTFLLAIAVIA
ncbi:MAG: hypothetical protein VKJ27_04730 [Synechocystis sp.]|nr:hypothetical protein [Synechocystis sp.]